MGSMIRECTKCRQAKPVAEFGRDSGRPDGLRTHCKACERARLQERREQETPEQREQRLAQKRQYQAERWASTPREVRNDQMNAYKAGIRKATCAVCGAQTPDPLCKGCVAAIRALGGTEEALKRAAKVVRYLGQV